MAHGIGKFRSHLSCWFLFRVTAEPVIKATQAFAASLAAINSTPSLLTKVRLSYAVPEFSPFRFLIILWIMRSTRPKSFVGAEAGKLPHLPTNSSNSFWSFWISSSRIWSWVLLTVFLPAVHCLFSNPRFAKSSSSSSTSGGIAPVGATLATSEVAIGFAETLGGEGSNLAPISAVSTGIFLTSCNPWSRRNNALRDSKRRPRWSFISLVNQATRTKAGSLMSPKLQFHAVWILNFDVQSTTGVVAILYFDSWTRLCNKVNRMEYNNSLSMNDMIQIQMIWLTIDKWFN